MDFKRLYSLTNIVYGLTTELMESLLQSPRRSEILRNQKKGLNLPFNVVSISIRAKSEAILYQMSKAILGSLTENRVTTYLARLDWVSVFLFTKTGSNVTHSALRIMRKDVKSVPAFLTNTNKSKKREIHRDQRVWQIGRVHTGKIYFALNLNNHLLERCDIHNPPIKTAVRLSDHYRKEALIHKSWS